MCRSVDRLTDRRTNRQTQRQIDRQTDGQTDSIYRHIINSIMVRQKNKDNVKRAIVKVRKAIREKYKSLRAGKTALHIALETTYAPLVNPLKETLQIKKERKTSVKKESDFKKEPVDISQRNIIEIAPKRTVHSSPYSETYILYF